jgi:diguanylate cyclase (GGDEF)-like protein/hemerythrin-like metal-binding protein
MKEQDSRFNRIFLKVTLVIMAGLILAQAAVYFHDQVKSVSFQGGYQITDIRYYNYPARDADISQILGANESSFRSSRDGLFRSGRDVWIKFPWKEEYGTGKQVVYLFQEFLQPQEIYISINGRIHSIPVRRYHIYPYAEIPSQIEEGSYVYMRIENFNYPYVISVRTDKHQEYLRHQNFLLAFRTANISILFVMFMLNLLLAATSKKRVYMAHAFFLCSACMALLQFSGIFRVIFGYNDPYFSYMWSFMCTLTAMLFLYSCFREYDLGYWVTGFYKSVMVANLLMAVAVGVIHLPVILFLFHFFLTTVFVTTLLVSLYAYHHKKEIPILFIAGMFLYFFSSEMYALGIFGIVPWNDMTANFIYAASAAESVIFTASILYQRRQKQFLMNMLWQEAVTDPLTGLYNRNYFYKTSVEKIRKTEQGGSCVSMMMFDLDHFKEVNDTQGHHTGDVLLQKITEKIGETVGMGGDFIRWGGDEFIVVLYRVGIQETATAAEEIRRAVAGYEFPEKGHVTLSVGAAEKSPFEDLQAWISRADESLYRAKKGGGNRISVGYSQVAPVGIGWHAVFKCRNQAINKEHEMMIQYLNRLIELVPSDDYENYFLHLYDELMNIADFHFIHEIEILKKAGYPDVTHHEMLHQDILHRAGRERMLMVKGERKASDLILFLIDQVVMGHMISEDVQFFSYL